MNEWDRLHRLAEDRKKQYPPGCRVQLDSMDDPQAPPVGTQGTVIGVDDIGSIMVRWDNGSTLSVTDEDRCTKIGANA